MKQPKKILVPIDLSERSARGLDYAAMMAKEWGSSLVLFCNINVPERAALEGYAETEHLTLDEAGQLQLDRLASERAEGMKVESFVAYCDSPAEGILAIAKSQEVDMIVVASHGRTGMTRWLLGSVAEKISRSADVPVVIVPTRLAGQL